MPSPLGHALAGVAAGWAVAGPVAPSPPNAVGRLWRTGLGFAVLGMLPDIDLVFGVHSGPTHGLGAAVIVGLAAALLTRRPRLGLASTAAYASHTLLDWLGSDTSAPIGIMALWPFNRAYYESPLHVFDAISRRYWLDGFWQQNLVAIGWEIAILAPAVLLVMGSRLSRSFRI
jgi:inner membrane protein